MESILLVGGGGHCHAVIDVIEQEARFKIAGIIDLPENIGKSIMGYTIIGSDDCLSELREQYANAIITVGQIDSYTVRERMAKQLVSLGYALPTIVSPLAYVAQSAKFAEGTVIMHQALINANAKIGAHCIINTKALIEHDAIVEDFCHVSTASVLNGGVVLEKGSFFGSNATSKQGIHASGFIKAGSIAK